MTEFDPVNKPEHYQSETGLEAIDVIEAFAKDNYHRGNAFKYLMRAGKKDDAKQDLEKAIWYIQREIESIVAEAPVEASKCDKDYIYQDTGGDYWMWTGCSWEWHRNLDLLKKGFAIGGNTSAPYYGDYTKVEPVTDRVEALDTEWVYTDEDGDYWLYAKGWRFAESEAEIRRTAQNEYGVRSEWRESEIRSYGAVKFKPLSEFTAEELTPRQKVVQDLLDAGYNLPADDDVLLRDKEIPDLRYRLNDDGAWDIDHVYNSEEELLYDRRVRTIFNIPTTYEHESDIRVRLLKGELEVAN